MGEPGSKTKDISDQRHLTQSLCFFSDLTFFLFFFLFFERIRFPLNSLSFPHLSEKMGTTLVLTKILCFLLITMVIGSAMIQCSITYDKKAIVINGHRRILLSGSIHYPRSTPEVTNLRNKWWFLFCFFFVSSLCVL